MRKIFWKEGMAYWHSDKQMRDENPSGRIRTNQYTNMKGRDHIAFDITSDALFLCITLENTEISLVYLKALTGDDNSLGGVYENFTVRWGVLLECLGLNCFPVWEFCAFEEDIWIGFIHTSLTRKAHILDDQYGPWSLRFGSISDSSWYKVLSL